MDEKKTLESLDQLFAAGEAWLRKYGVVTNIAHNAIVTNLYVNFPKVRYLEYFLPQDVSRNRKVWVILYVPFWKLLLTNRERMIDDVIMFLREYLDGYDIQVELKRYKKGIERSNEIPENAINHVAPSGVQPESENSAEPGAEPAADAGASTSQDPANPGIPESKPGDGEPLPDSSDSGEPKS